MKKERLLKAVGLDLEICKVERVEKSWYKRVYIKNLSDTPLVWEDECMGEIKVRDFYICTTDLLNLKDYSDYYIYTQNNGEQRYALYDNELISMLEDEYDNDIIDYIQILLVDYLIDNNLPPQYLEERMYEGEGERVFDSLQENEVKGMFEERFNNPCMEIHWSVTLEKDKTFLDFNDKKLFLNICDEDKIFLNIYNDILNNKFLINGDKKKMLVEQSVSSFNKKFNKLIDGKYDWSKGDYDNIEDEDISEEVIDRIKFKLNYK